MAKMAKAQQTAGCMETGAFKAQCDILKEMKECIALMTDVVLVIEIAAFLHLGLGRPWEGPTTVSLGLAYGV